MSGSGHTATRLSDEKSSNYTRKTIKKRFSLYFNKRYTILCTSSVLRGQ